MSDQEDISVAQYKSYGEELNAALRGGKELLYYQQGVVRGMDAALARGSIPNNLLLYRGVHAAVVEKELRPHSVVHDKGYLSTTGSRQVADFVAREKGEGYVMKIRVKKGTQGIYIDGPAGFRPYDDEREFVFPRGRRIRILGINDIDRTIDAVLEK